MSDEFLTINEWAGFLKLAEKTVYSMAQKAELPAFKARGQWRIWRVGFEALGARQTDLQIKRTRGGRERGGRGMTNSKLDEVHP
jgi:excisionase family DNA binding protein